MDRTLLIVKPDAVKKNAIGDIIRRVEERGFVVRDIRMLIQTSEQAGEFYEVHKERPFYNDLVEFMTSGPCVPMVLERDDAVPLLRKVVGATNPEEADEGTIRKAHGANVQNNAVHASDSPENAANEITFYFQ
ncbi:MAG: nucleoside-diphosphate kinase [Gemmatimonadetes bacterium]|nr:nucleoside-diphosphate kinase [Gemmatimonadota bacterium]|tara:strand:+ start:73 stop:471 length:399 start_codon:yes stop_codon:yes gene_type:complete